MTEETVKIVRNMVRCNRCFDVIESTHVHDFKFCSCESVAVDGGLHYLKRSFTPDESGDKMYLELSLDTSNEKCPMCGCETRGKCGHFDCGECIPYR